MRNASPGDAETAAGAPSEAGLSAVTAALAGLFAGRLEVACAVPRDRLAELHPTEQSVVQGAGARRVEQFSTGRACAREVLGRLGFPEAPIRVLASRAPAWPAGSVGSLSHTGGCCAAAAGGSPPWIAVGLDVESDAPLAANLEPRVCTPAERRWLASQPRAERGGLAKLIFSVKEAIYKLQHPLASAALGFQDVEVELDPAASLFRTQVSSKLTGGPVALRNPQGRFARLAGFVLAGVALRDDGNYSM